MFDRIRQPNCFGSKLSYFCRKIQVTKKGNHSILYHVFYFRWPLVVVKRSNKRSIAMCFETVTNFLFVSSLEWSQGWVPSLPLLALGFVYIGQGNIIQSVKSLIFFIAFFVSSWIILWADGVSECGLCLAGGRGCWLKGSHQVPSVSWI